MLNKFALLTALAVMAAVPSAEEPRRVALGDWPDARGPHRDGTSRETGTVEKWALNGENFLWRIPMGGRSAPIVIGDRVCVQNPSGGGATLQERIACVEAETGKVIWEYKSNIFQNDAPLEAVGWASPVTDPETGNIYTIGINPSVTALSKEGRPLWGKSLVEEFPAFTPDGGRTMTPIIDGDLIIVSAPLSNWGTHSSPAYRFIAMNKRTGAVVYVATPGGRPSDTASAAPFITTVNGQKLLISGAGDGAVYAIKAQTGEKVWSHVAAKHAINTGVVAKGNIVIVTHGGENSGSSEVGLIGAIDATQTGDIKTLKWGVKGTAFGFSSPVIDGDRVYAVSNDSKLHAFDIATGKLLWKLPLGTAQKAPLAFADGKLYVGTEDGKFFIVKPSAERAEILSAVELPASKNGVTGAREAILGGAAVSRGRVFFASRDALYAIGSKSPKIVTDTAVDEPVAAGTGTPTYLQIEPTELVLTPGQKVKLRAKLFDDRGRFLRDEKATWTLEDLKGTITDGELVMGPDVIFQAGLIKATAAGLKGEARARVIKPLPWTETFDSWADGAVPPGWVNASTGKFSVTTLDGKKVLQKAPDSTRGKRARVFMGAATGANYTVEADVRAMKGGPLPDLGITSQRQTLALFGKAQQLKLEVWAAENNRTAVAPFKWDADTWYHLKLRVEQLPDGSARARAKAWPTSAPEPAEWLIDKTDPIGNHHGAPGLFVDAQSGAYIDNLKVMANQQ